MKAIKAISTAVQRCGEVVLVLIASVLVVITFYGVVMRFVFNAPPTWQYELSIVLFAWLTFIGAALAFKRHEHIKLDILERRLKGVPRKTLELLIQLIVLAFLIIGIFGCWQLISQTVAQKYTTIKIPVATFYASFFVCVIMSIVFVLERTINMARQSPAAFRNLDDEQTVGDQSPRKEG